MNPGIVFIFIAGLAVAYPIIMRMFLDLAQPLRLKMAALGNELLDDEALPERDKRAVARMMDDAFDWHFMLAAIFKAPEFAWKQFKGKLPADPMSKIRDPILRDKVRRLAGYFALSSAAANPFCFVIVIIEIVVLTGILRTAKALNNDSIKEVTRRVVARAEYAAAAHAH